MLSSLISACSTRACNNDILLKLNLHVPDLNPAIEVGTSFEFKCPPGFIFMSQPMNAPRIPVTCGTDGLFTKPIQWGALDDWPACVNRKKLLISAHWPLLIFNSIL